jgi:hypothetical protein
MSIIVPIKGEGMQPASQQSKQQTHLLQLVSQE